QINGLFVEIGDYKAYKDYGVNARDCGIRFTPEFLNIKYDMKCFPNNYTVKQVMDIYGPHYESHYNLPDSRIGYGVDSKYAEAPWAVKLVMLKGQDLDGWYCSGSLVTTLWVLTAAHCFDNGKINNVWKIMTGKNWRIPVDTRHKDVVVIHENYTKNTDLYDLALVRLDSEFWRLNDSRHYLINTICLPESGRINHDLELATLFGFGWIGDNGTVPDILQRGQFIVEPWTECPRSLDVMDIYGPHYEPHRNLPNSRIGYGVDSKYAEAPWAVKLIMLKRGDIITGTYCSGSLVTTLWVLTAAHCFDGDRINNTWKIITGKNWRKPVDFRFKDIVIIHENYTKNTDLYDLALVRLNSEFWRLNDSRHYLINTICLPNAGQINNELELATLFGVPAEKRILMVGSVYFRAMFSGSFAENDKKEIEIKDTTYEAFKAIVWYLYTHELSFDYNEGLDCKLVADVCKLADAY
ncbi:unnamed protein product, partial [Medioppia subpectinata]